MQPKIFDSFFSQALIFGLRKLYLFKLSKNARATLAEILEFNFVSKLFLLIDISLVVLDILFCNSVIIFDVAAIRFFIFLRSVWASSDGNGFDLPF